MFPRVQATLGHKGEGLDGVEQRHVKNSVQHGLAHFPSVLNLLQFTTSYCELKTTQNIPLPGTAPGKGLFYPLEPDQWAQGRCSGPGAAAVGLPLVPEAEQSTGRDE